FFKKFYFFDIPWANMETLEEEEKRRKFMNGIGTALLAVQTICAVILVGLFFLSRKGQASPVSEKSFQCQKEAKELSQMRKIALTKPLAEQIRPTRMQQI